MEGRGIRAVEGEAEAVADHGADQGTFDVAYRKRHGGSAPRADRPYQSRHGQGGKRGSATLAALACVLVPAFCAAAWHHSVTLGILAASALLFVVPIRPRWWPRREIEVASPARRSAADIAMLAGCWLLATWALWQHRVLPLVVCAVAGALVLIDVASRPEAPPPVCVPERTPRRRALTPDPDL